MTPLAMFLYRLLTPVYQHAALLTTWSNNQYNARSEERDDLRRERKNAYVSIVFFCCRY